MRVSIIGTGNIGTDLLLKILKIKDVELVAFVGRRASTKPLPSGVNYQDNGIDYFIENPKCCDLVFDCTDAFTAATNSSIFQHQGIRVIDMTPSKIGHMCTEHQLLLPFKREKREYDYVWWSSLRAHAQLFSFFWKYLLRGGCDSNLFTKCRNGDPHQRGQVHRND